MVNHQQFIAKLKELSADTALKGLQRPTRKDSYEYGELSGKVQGLAMAEELLLKLLEEGEDKRVKRGKAGNPYQTGL